MKSTLMNGNFKFLTNLTDKEAIDREILNSIENAKDYIIMDMFLFNDVGSEYTIAKKYTNELYSAFLRGVKVKILIDPINSFYYAKDNKHFTFLKNAGVEIAYADLSKNNKSNPMYSWIYDNLLNKIKSPKFIENKLIDGKVGFDNILSLLNFNANHRKNIIIDGHAYISTANIHSSSYNNLNCAVKVYGDIVDTLVKSEQEVFNAVNIVLPNKINNQELDYINSSMLLITDGDIKSDLLANINSTIKGEKINILMFYLSDIDIVNSLKLARKRGVIVNIILDQNKNAFGYEKSGLPNKQTAMELNSVGCNIKWYNAEDQEQMHCKLMIIEKHNMDYVLFVGSANFTCRNIGGFNNETLLRIVTKDKNTIDFFNTLFYNDVVIKKVPCKTYVKAYTYHYQAHADNSILKYILYLMMEKTGLSTF